MTLLTSQLRVTTRQREGAQVVIEASILPIRWGMAGSTIRSKPASVCIILLVTGIAIHGRILELSVYMT